MSFFSYRAGRYSPESMRAYREHADEIRRHSKYTPQARIRLARQFDGLEASEMFDKSMKRTAIVDRIDRDSAIAIIDALEP